MTGFWVVWGIDNWCYFRFTVLVSVHLFKKEKITKGYPFGLRIIGTWNYFNIRVSWRKRKTERWVIKPRDVGDLKGSRRVTVVIGKTLDTHRLKNKIRKTKMKE